MVSAYVISADSFFLRGFKGAGSLAQKLKFYDKILFSVQREFSQLFSAYLPLAKKFKLLI